MWYVQDDKKRDPMYPAIEQIAKAFQNDPRTQIANKMMAQGTSNAPVAAYGHQAGAGIGRLMQSLGGALQQKAQLKRYDAAQEKEVAFRQSMAEKMLAAMQGQQAPQGGMTPPPGAFAAQPAPSQPQAGPPGVVPGMGAPTSQGLMPGISTPPPNPLQAIDPDQAAQYGNGGMIPPGMTPPFSATPVNNAAPQGVGGRGAPVSFKAAEWDAAEAEAARVTGVRPELIRAIRVFGERSNNNQVSSAGARGVYQFIPSTRRAFQEKYGVDAWANDPVQQATAAALHLKESLERNGGKEAEAVGEYIGGTDRKNWKSVTRAYVNRVARGLGGEWGTEGGANPSTAAPRPEQYDPQSALKTAAPTPYAEPEKPQAEGPSRSYKAQFGAMLMGSPYSSDQGLSTFNEGLSEQLNADEAAAARRQGLTNAQYQARLGRWGTSQTASENDVYAARESERGFGNQMALQTNQQGFQAGMQDDAQAHDVTLQEQRTRDQWNLAGQQYSLQRGLAAEQYIYQRALQEQQINGRALTEAEKKAGRTTAWLNTPQGARYFKDATAQDDADNEILNDLTRFENLNERGESGGVLNNVPGVAAAMRWSNTDLQQMNQIQQKLSVNSAKLLPGAASDKEGQRLLEMYPNTSNSQETNRQIIAAHRNAAYRRQMRRSAELEAMAQGGPQAAAKFRQEWNLYLRETPLLSGVSFDDWKANKASPNGGADVDALLKKYGVQ